MFFCICYVKYNMFLCFYVFGNAPLFLHSSTEARRNSAHNDRKRRDMEDDNPWTMTMVSPTPSRSRGVGRCTRKDSVRKAYSLLERMRRRRRQQLRSQIARPQTKLQVVECHHQHCGALARSRLRRSRPLAPRKDGEAVQHGRFRLHLQRPHVLCRYLRLREQQQEAF